MYDLLVCGGRVVSGRGVRRADVGVRGGRVARVGALGRRARREAGRVVDASGCLVIPGAVDPHVHFALPIGPGMRTADDFDTGSRAAAAGGVTTVIDYTTPQPGQRPLDAFGVRRREADGAIHIDYNLHNVLTGWEPGWERDLAALARAGTTSVKLFMIYRDRGWQANDGMMLEVMEQARRLGLVVCVHAENDALIELYTRRAQDAGARVAEGLADARPPLVEEEAARRAILLARASRARLHLVHLSTAGAAAAVGRARRQGVRVSGETCPQYLVLDRRLLAGPEGHLWGCCPPLRRQAEREGLWQSLERGWLQAVGTDHCTFDRAQKATWKGDFTRIPYGLPGVETALALTWTHGVVPQRIGVRQWVRLHAEGPARLFGLYPRKGRIGRSADADLVVWDPAVVRRIHPERLQTHCDWTPYRARRVEGIPRHVFVRGTQVASEGRFVGPGKEGSYVGRSRVVR